MGGADILLVLLLFLIMISSIIFLPAWMIRRNTRKVIAIFRKNNAIDIKNAKTASELGITPRSFLENIGRLRDYKPKVLELLIKNNVVNVTEEGKLYITDESVANITWLKREYTQY
jgi:hypothetical protein